MRQSITPPRPRQIPLGFFDDAPSTPTSLPPHNQTRTSAAAAEAVSRRAPNLRELVFSFLLARGPHGATADEVCQALDMWPQTATPRINELAHAGRINDSGRTRPTRSGRAAIVWTVTHPLQEAAQ